MSWNGIVGHDQVVEQFRRAIQRGRLASSFLFAGPSGIGKRTFALKLAQALLCQQRPAGGDCPEFRPSENGTVPFIAEALRDPCGQCPSCTMAAAMTHPDLELVAKPPDKSFIPLELLIGERDHRGQEGLCAKLSLRPYMGGRKIAVIDDADYLNEEGANSLLKTLEEPPPRSVLILIGTSPGRQLPTIRSRCQLVRFRPLDEPTVAELLVAQGIVSDSARAAELARHSRGSLQLATELADPALWEFRQRLCQALAARQLDSLVLAQAISAFVDEAGKEASPRRARLRQIVGFAAEFYRRLLELQSGLVASDPGSADPLLQTALESSSDPGATVARLDRCLDALEQIDRNANQSTLIEAWIDALAAGDKGDRRIY